MRGSGYFKNKGENMNLDRDKDIRAQGQLKSIWESGGVPKDTAEAKVFLEEMLAFNLKLIESYAKLEPLKAGEPVHYRPNAPESPTMQHLSDERVAEGVKPESPNNWANRGNVMEEAYLNIAVITEKEYKPKKFRYGVKGSDGRWFSSFFKAHYQVAEEAKNSGKQVKVIYEVGEYNGKPQYTIQSISLAS